MSAHEKLRSAVFLLAALCLIALTGCVQTKIQVSLDPAGGGTRSIEISLEEDSLEDLELSEQDVHALLGLDPARGWTSGREERVNEAGQSRTHLVFTRDTSLASVDAWSTDGPDFSVSLAPDHPARLLDEIHVEAGRGAGYRTLEYRETLDARSVKDLLDRFLADRLAQGVSRAYPALDDRQLAELRGIFRAHLSHFPSIVIDDDEEEEAREQFTETAAPQAAWILWGDFPSPEQIETTRKLLANIFDGDDEDMDAYFTQEIPGLSLLAFMNLGFEISMPGRIVETNADRSSGGFAAWERPIWSALEEPIMIRARARIDE